MKIMVTVREVMDKGLWDRVCEMMGFSPYCVNEGLMDSDDEIPLSEEQAKMLGLLTEDRT